MFSTDCAVSAVENFHVSLNILFEIPVGDQESKKPDGQSVIELQLYQDLLKLLPDDILISGKPVRLVQLRHASSKFCPLLKFKPAGNDNSVFMFRQASVKSVPPLKSIFAGKLMRSEDCHARKKVVPLLKSKAGKLVRPLSCHALSKFTLFAAVPSFASAGKDVRAVVPCHADVKFVPLLISSAGNDVSEELLNHEFWKFVPLLVSMKGKEVSEPQLCHA